MPSVRRVVMEQSFHLNKRGGSVYLMRLCNLQDIATMIPKGSVEWDKAMRCLRQALRSCVSTDWWKRVLVLAPRFKKGPQSTGARTGSIYIGQPALEFSAEMTCDAVVERIMELMQPLPTGNCLSVPLKGVYLLLLLCHSALLY